MEEGAVPESSLARSAASGVKWTMAATAVASTLTLVQAIAVARILDPAEYGLMAAAIVVIGLGRAFADGGLSAAIIARRMSEETISSLYWFNLATGLAVAAVVALSAPLVADFYRLEGVEELVLWSSLLFLAATPGGQFGQLIQRDLDFRLLAGLQVISAAAGTAVAIGTALAGAGAVSLVWGMLTTVTIASVWSTVVGWRRWPPKAVFRWSLVRRHLDFGAYQMGERAVTFGAGNVDYLIIGRLLGAGALGTFSIAYQIVLKPVVVINPTITRVAFPLFARRQNDDAALRRGYLQVVRSVAYVTLPLLCGLAVVAPDFVAAVLGDKWSESVPVLRILCLLGVIGCLANPVGTILLAKNRPDLGFKGNVVRLVVTSLALLVAVPHGLIVTAWVEVVVLAGLYLFWLVMLRRLIGMTWAEYWGALRTPVLLTAALVCTLLLGRVVLAGVAPALALALLTALGGLAFAGGALLFDGRWVQETLRLFRRPPAEGPRAQPAA